LEDALEEAEFFASRGLFEDAMGVLEEQGQRFPNHPLLVERMREIAEAMAAAGGSGEHAVPLAPHLEVVEDNAFDIAASLDALDSNLLPQQPEASDGFGKAVDVEEVFAKFKEGVKSQVSESDSQTHYDLGMAYKEMGLLSDAVAEFTMAARDPKRECVCWSMIGIVRTEIGDSDGAIEAFIRGLHAEHKTVEQELALYFELGAIYQARDNPQEALYYFEKVMRRDPNFRDVAQRVRTVQPSTEPSRLKAAGGVDDFDQAFDDLFGTSKLSR
jgi:tetratricopeptide (TPR) repeat protein